MSMQEKWSYST